MFAVRAMGVIALGAVLTLSACGGGDDDDGDAATGGDTSADAEGLVFRSSDALKFDPTNATAKAGHVHITHENEGATPHTFVIDGTDFKLTDDDDGDVELAAGDYTFYCDVPGHRDAGMEGTLTVTP
jgi:uncharacterized cupredoxin-like copper-binding protein